MLRQRLAGEFRHNPALPVGGVFLLALLALHTLPILSPAQLSSLSQYYIEHFLRVLLVVGLLFGLERIESHRERLFWQLITYGFAIWFVGNFIFSPEPTEHYVLLLSVIEDALFAAFFPLVLIALALRPHEFAPRPRSLARLSMIGIAAYALAVFAYYGGVSIALDRDAYYSAVPSYAFFVTLDLAIVIHCFVAAYRCGGKRWRTIYSLIGISALIWTVCDVLETLLNAGRIELGTGGPADFIWYSPYFIWFAVVSFRNRTANTVSSDAQRMTEIGASYRSGQRPFALLAYAGALPIVHFVTIQTGILAQDTMVARGVLALCSAAVFLSLAAVHVVLVQRRRGSSDSDVTVIVTGENARQSQKMESLGRLAGGIAHDFNNMLTVMQGYADLLALDTTASKKHHAYAHEMSRAVERAGALTHQLLVFSRRQVVEFHPLDLNKVIKDTSGMLRRLISEDIELETRLDRDLWRTEADPAQIMQVLLNFAANSREAMPGGGRFLIETRNIHVEATDTELRPIEGSGDYVRLRVTDTGRGMDEATRARAFEPFFTSSQNRVGTGLGLATVYGIVKQAKGHIGVDSEPDRGTTFRIYLPRSDRALPTAVPAPTAPARQPREGTILVAEDEADLRRLICTYLSKLGYKVLEACDGREAAKTARQHDGAIDLLLTDMVMPGMDGVKLSQDLDRQRPGVRVLYMSGYPADESRLRAFRPGTLFLQKPFSLSLLGEMIHELIGTSPASTITSHR